MRTLRFACLFVISFSVMMLAQSNPVPLLNQPLVPERVAPGRGKFTLTINGTGFVVWCDCEVERILACDYGRLG